MEMRSAIWRSSFRLAVVNTAIALRASLSTPSMVLPDISGSRHRVLDLLLFGVEDPLVGYRILFIEIEQQDLAFKYPLRTAFPLPLRSARAPG